MDERKPIGKHTAAELRDDQLGLEAVAHVTGLSVQQVVSAVRSASHGAIQARNLFREAWPWSANSLGQRTVAFAREHGLHDEVQSVTGVSRRLVSRRLNAVHGKQLLKNLFWEWWPDDQMRDSASSGARTSPRQIPVDDDDREAERPPDGAAPQLGPGSRLSERYEIKERLGSGGFGTTWRAHDHLSGLDLVIKSPHVTDGAAIRNELHRAFRLVHPNICQSFPDRDDDTGQPFLVMQYGGQDLASRIGPVGREPVPLATAVHVLVSIADALDYLHEQLVLHLDVSPGNILIDEDDVVRLTDFGASSRARAEAGPSGQQTRVATTLHSLHPCYAAPELYEGSARGRSDQYSLFRVFCSLLDGRVHTTPHYNLKPFAVLSAAQNDLVAKALSYNPVDRFESCAEPARALAEEMARAPEPALAGDIDRLAQHFVHRVELEQRRIASNTVRLGGALKLGRGLERLLQALLLWMGRVDSFDPLEAVREIDPHAGTLDRATSGTIAKTIIRRSEASSAGRRPEVASLIADLADRKDGKLWSLINARNDVIHGRRPPEALLPAASAVAEILRTQLSRGPGDGMG